MWRSDISVATKMVTNNLSLLSILGVPLVLVWSDLLDSTRHFPDHQPQHQQRVHSLTCFGSEIGCCSQHKCAKALELQQATTATRIKPIRNSVQGFIWVRLVGRSVRPSVGRYLTKFLTLHHKKRHVSSVILEHITATKNEQEHDTESSTYRSTYVHTYIDCSMYIRVNNISLFTTKNN